MNEYGARFSGRLPEWGFLSGNFRELKNRGMVSGNALVPLPSERIPLTTVPGERVGVRGATIYQENHCSACHQLRGSGMKIGPPLDGVASRHDRAWLEQHFKDPGSVTKGSKMPAYRFGAADMDAL